MVFLSPRAARLVMAVAALFGFFSQGIYFTFMSPVHRLRVRLFLVAT